MKLPKTCEIYPLLLIHAQDTKHAGAARLWVLAASLDHTPECDHLLGVCKGGSGRIARATLEAAALELGVKRSTFFYWLADARAAGILNGTGEYLYMASQEKLSKIVLCNSIDQTKAIVPLKLLFKTGWKDIVFAAYLKVNHHKQVGLNEKLQPVYKAQPVSARTIEDITGIKERTQRRYKKYIKSRRNIAITAERGSYETAKGLNEETQRQGKSRHYFTYNDTRQTDPAGVKKYRRVIAHTLPARRTVSDKHARIGARGRRAQIERAISKGLRLVTVCNYSDSYYPARPAQASGKPLNREARRYERRYFDKFAQEKDLPAVAQDEKFIERRRFARVGVWDRVGEAL